MNANKTFTIVAIGASAGGLEPLETLISKITSSDSFTYVITQHLDPNKPTELLEILSRVSPIPISMIENSETIKSNRIYICPPSYDLIIEKNCFQLIKPSSKAYFTPSIDKFFISLAQNKEDESIGIILSGAGSDGSKGIEVIKNAGGITIAQEEATAMHPEMPKSAINTNHIDLILPASSMVLEIQNILKYPFILDKEEDYQNQLNKIYTILFDKTNTDFSDYKTSTIQRRIKRRMILNKKNKLSDYIDYLKDSEKEVFLLHKELLVIVTSFFRDKEAFLELERTVENLLLKKENNEPIRVWVSGCATGEEAYTIAIILYEILEKNNLHNKIQIFATDISSEAIDTARKGVYLEEDLKDLNQVILDKYFEKKDGEIKLTKEIRDLIVFSKHDIIKDPAFLNMDLITCRNLLIYFNPILQKRIFSIFFNVLRQEGFLFLGKSESTINLTNLFSSVNSKSKIFKKDLTATSPTYDNLAYNHKKFTSNTTPIKKNQNKNHLYDSLSQTILEQYIQNYIIINKENNIVYTQGELDDYMKLPKGGFTQELFSFLKDNIRVDVRTAIIKARRENEVVKLNIKLNKEKNLQIDVLPIIENHIKTEGLCIIFKENEDNINIDVASENRDLFDKYNRLNIQELELELIETKERLQAAVEDLQSSNEELQSTNEEFQSSNEELQSSNEELQSTNEELIVVNEELEQKSKELIKAKLELEDINNNLENLVNEKTIEIKRINKNLEEKNNALTHTLELFENTFEQAAVGIAHLSLDGKWLKVNSKFCEIVGYSKEELVASKFKDITHPEDLDDDLVYIARLLKGEINNYSLNKRYYKKDRSIVWINITSSLVRNNISNQPDYFINVIKDISLQKEYEEKLKLQKDEFETIFDFSHDSIVIVDLDMNLLKFNKAFLDLTGYSQEYLLSKNYNDLATSENRRINDLAIKEAIKTGHVGDIEKSYILNDKKVVTVNMSATLLPNKKNILLSLKDISNLKIMEEQSKLASMGEMIGNIAHQWRQPLSVITTSISGLKVKSEMSGIDISDINICEENILKQANYLSDTIDNFRNFLKPEVFIRKISIISLVENTLSIASASLSNNYINIILDLEDDISIDGNINELTESLINIINNSKDVLKNNIKDEVERLLFISTKKIDDKNLELKILDSGGGIKDSLMDKIFEPYFTTKHQFQGTGLGLSISYKIITQRYFGNISVCNENFEYNNRCYTGACFKILFKNLDD
jgi:two-component system, chemotaxis family, CheB/CheR fusion protein